MDILYRIFQKVRQSAYFELKKKTGFNDIDLCMALCRLIQTNKIYQKRIDNAIVYGVVY
ncbi:hypothetical protein [Bacteroides salyersiae]|uniref:hypothetical protein n=1 Tax=Bacteroides salyersiae TaxID=291644 RepID=UPI00189B4CBD|nr:hypothetical protein [Bacteroides salyersiae]